MRKLSIVLFLSLFCTSLCWATSVVYRESSGEVVRITDGSTLGEENRPGFALVVDPVFIDGQDWLDPNYEYRVLGYAKIYDSGVVRNATQVEIDTFYPTAVDDVKQIEADKAKSYFQNDEKFRRIMIAFTSILVDRFNADHQQMLNFVNDLKQAVADATSLADFKSRVAAIDNPNLPTGINLSDVRDAIRDRISKDD